MPRGNGDRKKTVAIIKLAMCNGYPFWCNITFINILAIIGIEWKIYIGMCSYGPSMVKFIIRCWIC